METGLCRAGLRRRARGIMMGAASAGRVTGGEALSLPADCGLSPETTLFPKESCRCPVIGVFGPSGSFCRFSNFDKSEDTGLMDEASGPLPGDSIFCVDSCSTRFRVAHVLSSLPIIPCS